MATAICELDVVTAQAQVLTVALVMKTNTRDHRTIAVIEADPHQRMAKALFRSRARDLLKPRTLIHRKMNGPRHIEPTNRSIWDSPSETVARPPVAT